MCVVAQVLLCHWRRSFLYFILTERRITKGEYLIAFQVYAFSSSLRRSLFNYLYLIFRLFYLHFWVGIGKQSKSEVMETTILAYLLCIRNSSLFKLKQYNFFVVKCNPLRSSQPASGCYLIFVSLRALKIRHWISTFSKQEWHFL